MLKLQEHTVNEDFLPLDCLGNAITIYSRVNGSRLGAPDNDFP